MNITSIHSVNDTPFDFLYQENSTFGSNEFYNLQEGAFFACELIICWKEISTSEEDSPPVDQHSIEQFTILMILWLVHFVFKVRPVIWDTSHAIR